MATTNFNLRGISGEAMLMLKRQAKKQNISVNFLILKMIEKNLGYSGEMKKLLYHDLDKLAGTWSEKEVNDFRKNTKDFERIDKDIW